MPNAYDRGKLRILRRVYNRRMRRVEQMARDPWPYQEFAFRYLMLQATTTDFGRQHGLNPLISLQQYRRRVPPASYEFYEPYIELMLKGERSVLWPGKVRYFSLTSGTTAERGNKYIPFTNQLWRVNRKAGRDSLFFHCHRCGDDLSLFLGQMLFLGGTTSLSKVSTGIYSGDLSAILSKRIPPFYKPYYLPGDQIAKITDWEEKIDRIAKLVQGRDVRMISGIPSWMLVLFEKVRKEYGDPEAQLTEIFPELRLMITGGVNVKPYRPLFEEVVGPDVDFEEVYPASETFVAIQDAGPEDGLLLMCDYGVFYEFIPAARIEEEQPPRLTVAEVETGVNYAVLITSPGGLYSYLLGDTVRFVSLNPHRIIVTGRTKHFLSAFGEHLIVEEAEAAVDAACRVTGAVVKDFTAAPVYTDSTGELPYHEWLVEFVEQPDDLERFARALDDKLLELNDDYAAHRRGDASLGAPRITVLRPESFFDFMKVRGKLGGQNKVPRLKNDREFADLLHGLQES
ncbi:MAG: hypothetical protein GF399_09450 [Candidatus Coatesbacteria bacterium]|nr:hypothetical protein [Candidatus Coatesbacteria bacterium]